jgi:hypothetical protein
MTLAPWRSQADPPADEGTGRPDQAAEHRRPWWVTMAMMIGFAISWPANMWLVRRRIKIPM